MSPHTSRQGEISNGDQVSSLSPYPSLLPLSLEQTASPEASPSLNKHDQSILVSGEQNQQELSDSSIEQPSMPSIIRFKGSPHVFKRRPQPILDPQQPLNSFSNPGTENSDTSPSNSNPIYSDLDLPIALRKGTISCTQHPLANYISYHRLSPKYKSFLTTLSSIEIPKTVEDALKDRNWTKAMEEEMSALERNKTWDMVPRPEGVRLVGCRWVF